MNYGTIVSPTVYMELVHLVLIIHTLCQDSSSRLVFPEKEGTKRL